MKRTQKIMLLDATHEVTLDGLCLRDLRYGFGAGIRKDTYRTDTAAAKAFEARVAEHEATRARQQAERTEEPAMTAVRQTSAARARPVSKTASRLPPAIVAPKSTPSRPLTAQEVDRLAGRIGPGTRWTAREIAAVEKALGTRLPHSFQTFVRRAGSVADEDCERRVLTAKEMIADTKQLVRVPRDTRWETDEGTEVAITCDHLVAFAADGVEARWCFLRGDGPSESPVYLHHQDDPRAMIRGSGWISKRVAKPDYADFAAWLRAQARRR